MICDVLLVVAGMLLGSAATLVWHRVSLHLRARRYIAMREACLRDLRKGGGR